MRAGHARESRVNPQRHVARPIALASCVESSQFTGGVGSLCGGRGRAEDSRTLLPVTAGHDAVIFVTL